MASEGPNFPDTAANAGSGTVSWADLTKVSADDADTTTCSIGPTYSSTAGDSKYLKVTDFDFTIPGGSTIDGVEVAIERNQTDDSSAGSDLAVYLVIGGDDETGDNKAIGSTWSESPTTAFYGGSADTWSRSGALTSTSVNATDFGVEISVINPNFDIIDTIFQIDYIQITVYYTAGSVAAKTFTIKGVGP